MTLTIEENLQGIFSLIFTIITLIIAIKIALKYIEYKKIEFILVGLAFIGLAMPWVAVAFKFLLIIIANIILSNEIFFIINLGIVSFTAICWVAAMMRLMVVKERIQKTILIICIIMAILFEIIFLHMVFTDTALIGTFTGTLQLEFTLFISLFILIITVIFEIPGLLFVRESLKSENPEIKLKAKFLLIGFLFIIFAVELQGC